MNHIWCCSIEWWKTLRRIWCFGVYCGSCQL